MSAGRKSFVYLKTTEAAKVLGISKQTLLRWFSEGRVSDVEKRDRNGWRLFTDQDISRIRKWMNAARQ